MITAFTQQSNELIKDLSFAPNSVEQRRFLGEEPYHFSVTKYKTLGPEKAVGILATDIALQNIRTKKRKVDSKYLTTINRHFVRESLSVRNPKKIVQ